MPARGETQERKNRHECACEHDERIYRHCREYTRDAPGSEKLDLRPGHEALLHAEIPLGAILLSISTLQKIL